MKISRKELAAKTTPLEGWFRIYLKLELPRRESAKQRTLLTIPMAQFYSEQDQNKPLTDVDIELEGWKADLPVVYIVFRVNKLTKDNNNSPNLLEFGDGVEYAVRIPAEEQWDVSAAQISFDRVENWTTYQTKRPDSEVVKRFPYEYITPEIVDYSFQHSLKPGDDGKIVLENISIPELDPNLFSAVTARIYPSTTISNEYYIFILLKASGNERVGYYEKEDHMIEQRFHIYGERVDFHQPYWVSRKDPHKDHDFVEPVEGIPVKMRLRYPRPMERHEPSRKRVPTELEPAPLGRAGSFLSFLKGKKPQIDQLRNTKNNTSL